MYCPECGSDAGEAKYCPECGIGLEKLRSSPDQEASRPAAQPRPAGRTTGSYAGSRSGRQARPPRPPKAAPAPARPARRRGESPGLSAKYLWLAVLGVAVVIGAVVVLSQTHSSAAAGGSSAPVVADTSGTYGVLVGRANGLYDQGAQAQQKNDAAGAARYFAAAARVYAAAWKQQPGDAGMGTDYATSLYYSGDTAGALKQVNLVLAKNPTFQNALGNKGIYLLSAMQAAKQSGQSAKAAQLRAAAKAAFQAAVRVDPASASGQQAAKSLSSL
jgi:hypothetical protein